MLCTFRLAYFEIKDKVYTQHQLIQVAVKHYTSQVTFRVALSPLLTTTVQFCFVLLLKFLVTSDVVTVVIRH